MNSGQRSTNAHESPVTPDRVSGASCRRFGQAMVEFALVSIIFLMVVLGAVDFGRAVYINSQLTNAVREGARYAQVAPTATNGIKERVIEKGSGLGLSKGDITVSCSPSACKTGNNVTVRANLEFSFLIQHMLGIGPLTMHAQATNAID